jgi:anti-anti-sigma factor
VVPASSQNDGPSTGLTVDRRGARAYIVIEGDVGAAGADRLRWYMDSLLRCGVRSVVVDLAGAGAMGASAIWTLRRAGGALAARDGELILTSPRSEALRLLALAGLADSVVTW